MSARARDKRAAQRRRASATGENGSSIRTGVPREPDGRADRGLPRLLAGPVRADDPVLRWTAVWCLLAAAALHAAVVAPHYAEWALEGWFFVALELTQVVVALALADRPSRLACAAGIGVNAAALVLWALSRTVGVPLGPAAGEVGAIGRVDLVTAVLELVAVVVLTVLVTSRVPAPRRRPLAVRGQAALSGVAVAALVVYAVGGGLGHDEDLDGTAAATASPDDTADVAVSPQASESIEGPVGVPIAEAPAVEASLDLAATDGQANRFDGDRFDTDTLRASAGVAAVLRFTNDGSQPHNVALFPADQPTERVFTGETIDPGTSVAYPFDVPEPGAYRFQCDLHPWMQGTFTVT